MKNIWLRIKYAFYIILSAEEIHCYKMGKLKGMHCEGYRSDGLGGRIYKYIPGLEPIRDYLTWEEFKNNNS